jgi:hypothetical protein
MDTEINVDEVMRLLRGGVKAKNTKKRWERIFEMYHEGKSFEEIAEWYGRSESTVRRLLKRAAIERAKQPGFAWPIDASGRKICDIPHPMPLGQHPGEWEHPRARPLLRKRFLKTFNPKTRLIERSKPKIKHMWCPVCRRPFQRSLTLAEVFSAETS